MFLGTPRRAENEVARKTKGGPFGMSDLSARTAVIVDRHPLWLDALQALLERHHLEVVGRATLWNDAERLARELNPDVLIVNSAAVVKDGDGRPWAPIARIKQLNPAVKCIVFSEDEHRDERERAFAAGVDVYCDKRAEPDDFAAAIRQAFDHSIFFATAESGQSRAPLRLENTAGGVDLTKREVEILRLMAEGHSNSQLAQMLWVTEQTIKFHLSNIYRKLEVANRTEASRWAQVHGLLDLHEQDLAIA